MSQSLILSFLLLILIGIATSQWGRHWGPYGGYGGYGNGGYGNGGYGRGYGGYGNNWGRYGGYGGYNGGWGQQAQNIGTAAVIGTDVAAGVLVAEEVASIGK